MPTFTHDTPRVRAGGLLWAAASAASFGMSGSLARGLMDAGWSAAAAVAVRLLLGAAVLVPVALVALRGRWSMLRRSLPVVAAYGLIAVAGCQLAYFNAVAHMHVGVALLIEFTAPVAVVAWMWLRHRERPGRLTAVGALISAVGLALVLDLVSGAQVNLVGILWALAAMAGAAVYFVLSAHEHDGLPGSVLAAAGLLVGALAMFLAGLVGVVPMTASTLPVRFAAGTVPWWLPVLGLGIVSAAVAYVTGIGAARRLGSRLASFVALLEVVAAMVIAWLLLDELPRGVQVLGGVMVLLGIVVVKIGENRAQPPSPGGIATTGAAATPSA